MPLNRWTHACHPISADKYFAGMRGNNKIIASYIAPEVVILSLRVVIRTLRVVKAKFKLICPRALTQETAPLQ